MRHVISWYAVTKWLLSENCTVRGRSMWLISAAGTYKPRYVVYMRFISHALTNQITVFRVAVLLMYIVMCSTYVQVNTIYNVHHLMSPYTRQHCC